MTDSAKTAPEEFVYDLDVPRRPTVDDVDPYTRDEAPEPLPGQLYAAQMNQRGRCVVAVARVSPVAIITIDFAGGTPFIDKLTSGSEVLEIADLTPTDNGTGDTSITWPENTFPIANCDFNASISEDGNWLQPVCLSIPNGVRVKTKDATSTLQNVRVKVFIY